MAKPETPVTPDLIAEIDATALTLLRKIGGDGSFTKEQSEILTEQVKAFDVVVKWAGIRKDLVPKEEPKATKFAELKGQFHGGSPAPRNRRGPNKAPSESSPDTRALPADAASVPDLAALDLD